MKVSDPNCRESAGQVPFWRTVLGYVGPYRGRIITAMSCALLVGVCVALQPIIIKYIIDEGISRPEATATEKMHYTLFYVGVYAAASAFRLIFWGFGYTRLIKAIEGFIFSLRAKLFRHVQGLCFRFHDEVSSGELYNYLMGTPINSVRAFVQQVAMTVPHQVVSWAVALVLLASMDWLLLLVLLAVVGTAVLVNFRSRRVVRAMSADFMATESSVSRYVADMLRGCREIKIHAAEDVVNTNFAHQASLIRDQAAALGVRRWYERLKPEGIQYAGMAAFYTIGAYSCIYRGVTVGTFIAFVNSVGLLMGPLLHMLELNLVKANAEAGLERLERVLERVMSTQELPANMRTTVAEQAARRPPPTPCIEFRNVTFSYQDEVIFRNLSCAIREGESVALVGPSGSGKSTFVNLVLRLYDPQEGRILLYGDDLYHYALRDLRSSFGVVAQSPFFFQASILENIRVVRPDATEEEVWDALRVAEAADFVSRLPEKLHTHVGEGGSNLSGGQRQRLAIARAILSRARFFIFDEATSALDNQSEARVQEAMEQIMARYTTIVIAHRLSTIRNVDRIFVLDGGSIVQDGAFDELAQTPGLFQTLLQRHVEAPSAADA